MAYKFKLVTKDYQDYDGDLIGVSKDAYVNKDHPTWNIFYIKQKLGVKNLKLYLRFL